MASLTQKQAAFVREYLIDLNATQAALRSGYSERTAEKIGSENLKKPEIKREIDEAIQRRADRVEIKADDILRELLRLARVDVGLAFDNDGRLRSLNEIPEDVRRAISSLEVEEVFGEGGKVQIGQIRKAKFWDKTKALELLGKHLKLFVEKMEHSGPDGKDLIIEIRKLA